MKKNRLREIFYKHRLKTTEKSLRENARRLDTLTGFQHRIHYAEQLRLMSCRSYLENKLSGIQDAN